MSSHVLASPSHKCETTAWASTSGRTLCVIKGCRGPHRSRGWCEAHYRRWRRYGDPLGQPVRDEYTDEVAVQRAVNGDPPDHLTQAEREAVVRRLHALGLNDRQIGERLGVQRAWVGKIRQRLDLPVIGVPGPPPGSRRAARSARFEHGERP